MTDRTPLIPFWMDMAILLSMTLPTMGAYALTSWSWLMPLGGINLFLALAIIRFIRHVRTTSLQRRGSSTVKAARMRG